MRNRNINDYIGILTYIWLKWIDNNNRASDTSISYGERKKNSERCQKIQKLRQQIIVEINDNFDKKLIKT